MKFDKDWIPSTIEEAIDYIFRSMSEKDIENAKKSTPGSYHFNIGMYLRNNWNMWDTKSAMNQDFQKRFGLFGHGDDLSGMILEGVWVRIRGEDLNKVLLTEADKYIKHWKKYGLDPKTGKELWSIH
jgi:hypothetical protein